MSTEHQLRVHFFSIFFTFALIYQEIEGINDSKIDFFYLIEELFHTYMLVKFWFSAEELLSYEKALISRRKKHCSQVVTF